MTFQCDYSGKTYEDNADGIYYDGDWISWDYINEHIAQEHDQVDHPYSELLNDLIRLARQYKDETDRYLPIFGEIGELYAEMKYGIARHSSRAQGSDGRLGKGFVEIKTITPEKRDAVASVKSSGHFNKIVVVRIDRNFAIEARIIDRKSLKSSKGKLKVQWDKMQS